MAKSRRRAVPGVGKADSDAATGVAGSNRESQILGHVAEFADQVVIIVEKMSDLVERFACDAYDELAEAAHELDLLESSADDTKEAILDRLAVGSMFPMNRADLARLVASMDSIANLAAGAADRISMRRFTLPEEMNELMVELAHTDLEAVKALRDAVVAMGSDLREAIMLARHVDKIESARTISSPSCSRARTISRPTTRRFISSGRSSTDWRTWPTDAARTPNCCVTWPSNISRASDMRRTESRRDKRSKA